ncbi:56kDa selenium binding family protein [Mycobacterium xenopi 4042]|uniref:56kDa selenium binding family protein n=1 Tax=Mycobacterium xenopi 4042 TaxID=1299334 RepID=X8AK51_MYCXE|nr:56kDa selenium binding family protein [Mycobacterium xenopi 4042]
MGVDRGPQFFAYDVWWHLRHDTLVTSEWATPSMLENGLNPRICSAASSASPELLEHERAQTHPAHRPG